MVAGRPIGLLLDPDVPGPLSSGTAETDGRGRLRLPARLVMEVGWIPAGSEAVDALVVLSTPGQIVLYSWNDHAQPIVDKRRQLIDLCKNDSSVFGPLKALEDRYKRLRIPSDLRPTLSDEILLHLGVELNSPSLVYVWRVSNRLEISSILYRNHLLLERWDELENLP